MKVVIERVLGTVALRTVCPGLVVRIDTTKIRGIYLVTMTSLLREEMDEVTLVNCDSGLLYRLPGETQVEVLSNSLLIVK